jgi:5-methylcytosine-specific restriction endonuclease McrA
MSDRVAVFNSRMALLGYVTLAHALRRICQGKAWALRSDPDRPICCTTFCLPAPLAIQTHGPDLECRTRRTATIPLRPLRPRLWHCAYCLRTEGELGDHEYFNRDHIVPKSRGGGTRNNLVISCNTCNTRKGSRTPREANLPDPLHLWVPTKAEMRRHRERRERRRQFREGSGGLQAA